MSVLFVLLFLIPFSTLATLVAWIGFYKEAKNIKLYAALYIYGVFMLSYCLIPDHDLDINRYWNLIEKLEGLSLSGAVNYLNDGLLVENLVFWIISKINMPHLLPAISTSIVYGVSTSIILDSYKRMNVRGGLFFVLAFQSLIFPYLSITANVRNICAFSIGIHAVYRELVKKKYDVFTLMGYVLPVFMHKTGILIIVIRLMVIVFLRVPILSASIVLLLPTIISISYNNLTLFRLPGVFGLIVRRLIASSNNYLIGGSEYAERLSHGHTYIVKYVAILCVAVQAFLLYKYYTEHKHDVFSKFAIFSLLLAMITFATTIFDTPAYWRFGMAVNISFFPILLYYFELGKKELFLKPLPFKLLMFSLAGMRFVIEAYRSMSRINFGATLNMLMASNAYTIVIGLIKALTTV